MKIPDPEDVWLVKTLKREGVKLGNRTVVDISAWSPGSMDSDLSKELFDMAFEVIKKDGYEIKEMPWLTFGYNSYGPGTARPFGVDDLGRCSEMYVGELKLIEPLLPCGRTHAQVSKVWDIAWERFKIETKQKRKRELTSEEEATIILKRYGITYRNDGSPNVPCHFRFDRDQCAPGACNRGKYISRGEAESLEDLLDDKHKKSLARIKKLTSEAWEEIEKEE